MSQLVLAQNLNRKRANFTKMDGNSLVEFPSLNTNELLLIACGTYQLKLAPSYYAEHSKEESSFEIQVCAHADILDFSLVAPLQDTDQLFIRERIHSRFSNSTKHSLYTLVDKAKQ